MSISQSMISPDDKLRSSSSSGLTGLSEFFVFTYRLSAIVSFYVRLSVACRLDLFADFEIDLAFPENKKPSEASFDAIRDMTVNAHIERQSK